MSFAEPERFSKLRYPIHKVQAKTPGELFKFMPGLRRYFEKVQMNRHTGLPETLVKTHTEIFNDPTTGEKKVLGPGSGVHFFNRPQDLVYFFKYTVYVYDPDSDLVDEYPYDIRLRKDAAAREAGWKRDHNGMWLPWLTEIFELKNPTAVHYIMDFLKVLKEPIWKEIVFQTEELDHIYQKRAEDLAFAIKNNYDDEASKRLNSLALLYKRFYAEHNDLRKVTEKEEFPISPENVFSTLNLPESWYKVRQTTDVS